VEGRARELEPIVFPVRLSDRERRMVANFHRLFRKPIHPIATCRICGQSILSNQSYHASGIGIAHLKCEYER